MTHARSFRTVLMVVLLVIGARGRARAAPPPDGMSSTAATASIVVTSWEGAGGCPDATAFVQRVASFVGNPPDQPAQVAVRIVAEPSRFVLTMRVDAGAGPGERELKGPTCAVVVEAAAFIVALTIDPMAGQATQFRPSPAALGIADDEIPPPITLERPAPARPPEPRGVRLFGAPFELVLRLMIGSDLGTLPEPATLVHAAVAIERRRWRIELGGTYVLEQRIAAAEDPSLGGTISQVGVRLRGCGEVYRGGPGGSTAGSGIAASLCAGGELGRFRSTGHGVPMPLSAEQAYATVGGGGAILLTIRKPLYFRLEADVSRPLARPRFSVCAAGAADACAVPLITFWQPAVVHGRAFAGMEVIFR